MICLLSADLSVDLYQVSNNISSSFVTEAAKVLYWGYNFSILASVVIFLLDGPNQKELAKAKAILMTLEERGLT